MEISSIPYPGDSDWGNPKTRLALVTALLGAERCDSLDKQLKLYCIQASRRIDPIADSAILAQWRVENNHKPEEGRLTKEQVEANLSAAMNSIYWSPQSQGLQSYLVSIGIQISPSFPVHFDGVTAEESKKDFAENPTAMFQKSSTSASTPRIENSSPLQALTQDAVRSAFLSRQGIVPIEVKMDGFGKPSRFQYHFGKLDQEYLQSSFRETVKYLALNERRNISQLRMQSEVFDSEYSEKKADRDGPAATLAMGVATMSKLRGEQIDESIIFIGDVNADGSVQSILDLSDRLLEVDMDDNILVMPIRDKRSAADLLLLEGASAFRKNQIIGVSHIQEAYNIGIVNQPSEVQAALNEFRSVQEVLNKEGGIQFLTNSHVVRRLQSVTSQMPGHLSAVTLLSASTKSYPTQLSIGASSELIFAPISFYKRKGSENISRVEMDDEPAMNRLKKYRRYIDPMLTSLADSVIRLSTSVGLGANSGRDKERLSKAVVQEVMNMAENPHIRERIE